MRAAPDAAVIPLAMLAMLAMLGACDRTPPLESCRGSLAGIWREEAARGDQRWAVIDVGDASGTRVEAYPLFDDTAETAAADAAAQLVRSPRSLDLIRSHTALWGHVERWVMRGGQKCLLRASARISSCTADRIDDRIVDRIDVQLGELPIPATPDELAACAAPPRTLPPPQRWRRLR
jgi:hypothetical protein